MTTSLSPAAAARSLALIVRRLLQSGSSGPVRCVPFGESFAIAVGDACLCTVSPADDGVSLEWAPQSDEARSLLLPLFAAMIS